MYSSPLKYVKQKQKDLKQSLIGFLLEPILVSKSCQRCIRGRITQLSPKTLCIFLLLVEFARSHTSFQTCKNDNTSSSLGLKGRNVNLSPLSQRTLRICFSTSYIPPLSLPQVTLHILFSLHALCSQHSSGCLRVSHSSAAAIPSLTHLKAFYSSRTAHLTQLCKHQLSSLTTEIVNQVCY